MPQNDSFIADDSFLPDEGFVPDAGRKLSSTRIPSPSPGSPGILEPEPEPPGLIGGIAETLLPSTTLEDYWRGPAFAIPHPIESMKLLGQAQKESFAELGRKRRETTGMESLGYGMAQFTPLVGPPAALAIERILKGEVRRGIGNIVGLVLPIAGRKLAGKVLPQKPVGKVPLLRSERTGSALSGYFEGIAARTVAGVGEFKKFRAQQQNALVAMGNNLVKQVSEFTGGPEKLGIIAKAARAAAEESFKDTSRKMFQAIDRAVAPKTVRVARLTEEPSTLVDPQGKPLTYTKRTLIKSEVSPMMPETRPLKQYALGLIRRIRKEQKLIPKTEFSRVEGMLTQILRGPKRETFSTFQDVRSDLLAVSRSYGDPIPGKAGGTAKHLAGLVDKSMKKAAESAGRTDVMEMFREANAFWEEGKNAFNESVLSRMVETSPEKVHTLLRNADLADIRIMRRTLGEKPFQAIKSQYLRDIIDESIQGEFSTAIATGGMAERVGVRPELVPTFNGRKFINRLEGQNPVRLRAMFSPEELAGIRELADTASIVGMKTQQGLIPTVVNAYMLYGAGRALYTASPGELVGPALTFAGINIVARAMTKPEGITILRNLARNMDKPAVAAFWGKRLIAETQMSDKELKETPIKLRHLSAPPTGYTGLSIRDLAPGRTP